MTSEHVEPAWMLPLKTYGMSGIGATLETPYMTMVPFIVDGDGVIHRSGKLSDDEIMDMIRFGTVVSVFRQSVAGIQYADVDPITHEIVWKFVKVQEE